MEFLEPNETYEGNFEILNDACIQKFSYNWQEHKKEFQGTESMVTEFDSWKLKCYLSIQGKARPQFFNTVTMTQE